MDYILVADAPTSKSLPCAFTNPTNCGEPATRFTSLRGRRWERVVDSGSVEKTPYRPTRVPNSSVRAADDQYPVTMPNVSIPQTTTEPQSESPYDNARARWDGTINSAESHSATLGPDDLRPIVDTRPSFYGQSSDWNILPTKPAEENLAEIPRESACSPKEGGTVIRPNEAGLTSIISTSDFQQRNMVDQSTIATTETQNFADGLYPVGGHDPHPTDQTSYYNEYLRGISWIDPWTSDNMPNSIFSSSSLLANIPEAVSEPTLYESGEVYTASAL
ncbi:hypothetical protein VKT23_001995 [Stygiomarasmius scandens]|uniref:Uncharacterized protein n=1 Tax=Marasmiellus scandens TaxID=2682957 RepID=A0ABR1K2L1_9AGAR